MLSNIIKRQSKSPGGNAYLEGPGFKSQFSQRFIEQLQTKRYSFLYLHCVKNQNDISHKFVFTVNKNVLKVFWHNGVIQIINNNCFLFFSRNTSKHSLRIHDSLTLVKLRALGQEEAWIEGHLEIPSKVPWFLPPPNPLEYKCERQR